MKKYNNPIVKTLLDTDAYKFHMQQAVFFCYKNVNVVAEFICRGPNILGSYSDILLDQINMMETLSLSNEEYIYMLSFPFFKKEYLHWLKSFRYNITQVQVSNSYGELKIRITGLWKEVILWEVPILSLISEIFYKNHYPKITSKIAVNYLNIKLKNFFKYTKNLNLSRLKIVDFGTRRRFSYDVQYSIIKRLKDKFPFLIGSSNYHFARILKLSPVGTQSHEWFQAHQQISSNLKYSQSLALKIWLCQYKKHLSIALTDCITMDSFLHDFNSFLSKSYQGIRHDSGDPIKWGEKALKHYNKLGINPATKTLLFSDNLDFKKIIILYKKFNKKINLIFGIGTKLTCDIPNVKPLNIVMKLVECNGKPVAKISDNPGKTFCLDKKFMKSLCESFSLPLNYVK